MITKELVKTLVEEKLQGTDYELQTLEIDKDMNILVEVDRLGTVDLDFCAELNHFLVERLGDKDDYALEVGSVSLTDPFKSKIQYKKNLGHNVIVADKDGKKFSGQLISVDEDSFQVEGQETMTFRYDEVKSVRYNITF